MVLVVRESSAAADNLVVMVVVRPETISNKVVAVLYNQFLCKY